MPLGNAEADLISQLALRQSIITSRCVSSSQRSRESAPPRDHPTLWGHFLRLLRFLRRTLVWRLPIGEGGRIGSKTPMHEARAAVATPSAPLNSIQRPYDKLLTAKWGRETFVSRRILQIIGVREPDAQPPHAAAQKA